MKKNPLKILSFYKNKWQSYDVWFLSYGVQWTNFFFILDKFCLPFYPSNNPKNQNFEKMKTTPRDIIILHMCTINEKSYDHSWDMERDGQNFLSFWTMFCTFTLLTTQKIKILKKMKKISGDIIILHMCTINDNRMM